MNNVTILIGESDDLFINLLTETIDDIISDKSETEFLATSSANKLLLHASDHDVDLFVLTLNNIVFSDGNTPGERRIEQAIQLIIDVKDKIQKPIIALSSWPNDPNFADRVISAGADRFYKLPVKLNNLREAIRCCLAEVADLH